MPLSTINAMTFVGIKPIPVTIEVHLSAGLPSFAIVGLADTEIRESKERVRSALLNTGFEFPAQRITVNLAPADLPKGSASYDLAIALGIAAASGQLGEANLENWCIAGELSLSGKLTGVRTPFALAYACRREMAKGGCAIKQLMVPAVDAVTAAQVPDVPVYGPEDLLQAASHLVGHGDPLPVVTSQPFGTEAAPATQSLDEVVGHESAKLALMVAATGRHHLRLMGPPGSGKSMLAQRLRSLLPPLDYEEALHLAAMQNLKGETHQLSMARPFRNPHASSSLPALVGGGSPPTPGEITLAHEGVLFTDEVLEFDRRCLEALREPLETSKIMISRAGYQAHFPANFLWVCAHNPCPCGYLGHPKKACQCTPEQIRRYQSKLSGPLADRLDLSVEVSPIEAGELLQRAGTHDDAETMQQKVARTRRLQLDRQQCLNGELTPGQIARHCKPDAEAERLLLAYAHQYHLSSRAIHRVCKVGRTLADLENEPRIRKKHVAAAIQYRKSLSHLMT